MPVLLRRDQKTLVVLLLLVLFGGLLHDTCCLIKSEPLVPVGSSAHTDRNSSSVNASDQEDPLACYRVPGSGVLIPFRVEINTAPAIELQLLPGIGPALSKTIVEWRKVHGPFEQIEDIQRVPGIGPKKYEAIQRFIYIQTGKPEQSKKR